MELADRPARGVQDLDGPARDDEHLPARPAGPDDHVARERDERPHLQGHLAQERVGGPLEQRDALDQVPAEVERHVVAQGRGEPGQERVLVGHQPPLPQVVVVGLDPAPERQRERPVAGERVQPLALLQVRHAERVEVGDERGDVADQERVEPHAEQHHADGVELLERGLGQEVAVADGRERGRGPVQRVEVAVGVGVGGHAAEAQEPARDQVDRHGQPVPEPHQAQPAHRADVVPPDRPHPGRHARQLGEPEQQQARHAGQEPRERGHDVGGDRRPGPSPGRCPERAAHLESGVDAEDGRQGPLDGHRLGGVNEAG